MKSTHICEVVPVTLEKHDGADTLSVITIFGGYTYVAKTESWQNVKKAVYICPDSLVDTRRPEFAFLATEKRLYEVDGNKVYYRIKAKKIRGIVSFGFMVPVPDETPLGEDWAGRLGVIHFDEDIHSSTKQKGANLTGGEVESPPDCYFVKYDVDSLRRYRDYFTEGEPVYITCKLHGASSRYVFHNNQMFVGSRSEWKREYATKPNYESIEQNMREKLTGKVSEEEILGKLADIKRKIDNWNPTQNAWWKGFRQVPGLEKLCRDNPDTVVYGELVGTQGGFNYGCKPGEVAFYAFDILQDGKWLDPKWFIDLCDEYDIPRVPVIKYNEPYSFEECVELAEGPSLVPDATNIREGVVIKPMTERTGKIGRVCLKLVGAGYLEKA